MGLDQVALRGQASETRREGSEERRRSGATPSIRATEQRSIATQIGPVRQWPEQTSGYTRASPTAVRSGHASLNSAATIFSTRIVWLANAHAVVCAIVVAVGSQ